MIHELRIYAVVPGRMPDLLSRFGQLPLLFQRHGIRCVGQWMALNGPRMPGFVYLMSYADFAERERSWAAFGADPDWLTLRAETNAGEEIVERFDLWFLRPHAALVASTVSGDTLKAGMHELHVCEAALGQPAATAAFLSRHWLPALRAAGAQVLGVFDVISGPRLPRVVWLLRWPDEQTRTRGARTMLEDAEMNALVAEQRKQYGKALLGGVDSFLLQAAPHADIDPNLGCDESARP